MCTDKTLKLLVEHRHFIRREAGLQTLIILYSAYCLCYILYLLAAEGMCSR